MESDGLRPDGGGPKRLKTKINSSKKEKWRGPMRIEVDTCLNFPTSIVQCALCGETMPVLEYQKVHLEKHNYLCWLTSEPPMDLNDDRLIQRVLGRVKVQIDNVVFRCPLCLDAKKTVKGFLNHIKLCGRTEQEKLEMKISCDICGRFFLPRSIVAHLAHHAKNQNGKQIQSSQPEESNNSKSDDLHQDKKLDSTCINELQQCKYCDFMTPTKMEMMVHCEHEHSSNPTLLQHAYLPNKDGFDTGLPFIPYLRNAENKIRRSKFKSGIFTPALKWTKEERSANYSFEKLFLEYDVELDEWDCKAEEECRDYLQSQVSSMRVALNSQEWFTLNLFECKVSKDAVLLFCGGPIFGLAWAPGQGRQFLAVCTHPSMEEHYMVDTINKGPVNIQIWSMGSMGNSKNSSFERTRLEYVICHDEGICWDLKWCPSGCQDEVRMGLLAVATAGGSVPIYSIPVPCKSEFQDNSILPICKPKPILQLELGSEKVQCTVIAWSSVKPHRIFGAGYVNGLLAFWDLSGSSPLLRKGRVILPFKTFQAHHAIVSGLCFSPTSDQYLVSSGHDKTLKFWDLYDTTTPQASNNKRYFATELTWLQHWMTCAVAIDSVYSAGDTTMSYNSIRDFIYEPYGVVTTVDSCALSISSNDWLNGVLLSHDNGQVDLILGQKQPVATFEDRRKYIKVLLEPNLFDFDKANYVPKPRKGINETYNSDIVDCNSYIEAAQKFGIDFKLDLEFGLKDALSGNTSNTLGVYPVQAANKVRWNPNIDSFLNLAVGYQSGFVLVPKLNLPPQDQLNVDNILES